MFQSQVTHEVFTTMAIDQEFEIPAGAENFPVRAQTRRVPDNAELLAITPHMHVRGKSFRLFGSRGEHTTLLHVPQYDFNWQHTYLLEQPLPLADFQDGLHFEATFDNSANNPFNPDPTQTVTWGDQTWEEMAVAFFEVARLRSPENQASPPKESATADASHVAQSLKRSTPQAQRQQDIETYVRRVFAELDANRDGIIQKGEADIVVRRLHFHLWDLNRDNVATAAEVRQAAEQVEFQ